MCNFHSLFCVVSFTKEYKTAQKHVPRSSQNAHFYPVQANMQNVTGNFLNSETSAHISLTRNWTEESLETCACPTLTVIFSMILSDLKDGTKLLLFILEAILDSLQSQESLPSLVAQRIGVLHQTEAVLGGVIAQHTVQGAAVRHGSIKLLQVLRRKERRVMC